MRPPLTFDDMQEELKTIERLVVRLSHEEDFPLSMMVKLTLESYRESLAAARLTTSQVVEELRALEREHNHLLLRTGAV